MMKPDTVALEAGAQKAVEAYGETVGESLGSAAACLRERPHRLDEYIRALCIDVPRAVVWQKIRDLAARCAKVEDLGSTASSTAIAIRRVVVIVRFGGQDVVSRIPRSWRT